MNALRVALFVAAFTVAATAAAEQAGTVFVDRNRNGAHDPGEPGREGVAVTNGRDVVRTGPDGRYELPDFGRFVYVTRPDGFSCASWYREGPGDFALVRESSSPSEFFFVHMTDVHAYDDAQDMLDYSIPSAPWFLPQSLTNRLALYWLRSSYRTDNETLAEKLADALPDPAVVRDRTAADILQIYLAEFGRDGSPLGMAGPAVRAALAEIDALEPEFVISTGDLVLESNRGDADAIERWFRFYQAATRELRAPVYDTIGNNEIAGTENAEFTPEDPRFGKYFFREFYGPTHYSFDHGDFHFTALDTHRPDPGFFDTEAWTFESMDDDVRAWLDADLQAHRDRTLVALNHEPFHNDPNWPFTYEHADDTGLFAKHDVRYSLAGHIHANGSGQTGPTEHITTGALSGFRWFLPDSIHPRGYRMFYAREGRLHSVWKPLGRPVVRWLEGGVGVAADAAGPFARIEARNGDAVVPLEPWGAYFVRHPNGEAPADVLLVGVRADGSRVDSSGWKR